MNINIIVVASIFVIILIILLVIKYKPNEGFQDNQTNSTKKMNVNYVFPGLNKDLLTYYGIIVPEDNNDNIIFSNSLTIDKWNGPIENISPHDGSVIIQIIYTPNNDLLGIGVYRNYNDENEYNIYRKPCLSPSNSWELVSSNKNTIRHILYDKSGKLIGCEALTGNLFIKKSKDITSDWEGPLNNNIPMKKIYYDRDRILLGIGIDDYIYKKRGRDWLNENWDEDNVNKTEVLDLLHDFDGKIIACTENGFYKQLDTSYMSPFEKLETVENGKKILSLNDIIFYKCGVNILDDYLLDNKNKNKNIASLNKVLQFKHDAKKMCKNKEFMLNEVDSKNSLIIQKQNKLITDIENMINELKDDEK